MNILIAYDTYSSTTESVVDVIVQKMTEKSHQTKVLRIRDIKNPDEIKGFDLVLFATPSWLERGQEGQPHVSFLEFIDAAKDTSYEEVKFAVIGLGNSTYAHFCQAADILETFMKDKHAQCIKETLKLDAYYENMERETPRLASWLDSLV